MNKQDDTTKKVVGTAVSGAIAGVKAGVIVLGTTAATGGVALVVGGIVAGTAYLAFKK